jgi:hypothetical protein
VVVVSSPTFINQQPPQNYNDEYFHQTAEVNFLMKTKYSTADVFIDFVLPKEIAALVSGVCEVG